MAEALCQVESCGRPVKDATVCQSCVERLEYDLGQIPALADELVVTLTRQARLGGGDGGRKSAETPLVFHYAASETSYVLRNTLVGWVRELSTDGLGIACGDTVADMARWLLARVSTLAQHPAGGEAVEEITSAVAAVRKVIDRPPGRRFLAACDDCDTDLYAHPGAFTVRCMVCGAEYDVAQRKERMRDEIEDLLYHSTAMSDVLAGVGITVPDATIRSYAKRGRILVKRRDEQDRPLYRVGDVLDLVLDRDRLAG